MVGRLFFLGILSLGLYVYMQAPHTHAVSATVTQTCDAATHTVSVALTWPAAPADSTEIWLDVGLGSGFAAESFTGHGPLPATQTSYALDAVPDGLKLYYRVNALRPSGWKSVASGSFVAKCDVPSPTETPVPPQG